MSGGVVLAVRLVLAALFAVAAVAKLRRREETAATLREFGVPAGLRAPLGVALPLAELAIAAGLVVTATSRWAGLAALLLLAVFTVALAVVLRRGRQVDCNCFGALGGSRVSGWTIGRNAGLMALAGAVAVAGPGAGLGSLDGSAVVAVAAALAGVLLLGLTWFCWQLFQQNGRLLVRVRALEEAAGGADAAPRAPRTGGLPQGASAPDLALATPGGASRSVLDLARLGRAPIALVFSDPGCRGCQELGERLPALRGELDGVLEPVLVTRDRDGHAEAAAATGMTVLVQEDREALFAFAVGAVPAAVVIDAEGRVASETAIGPDAVEQLLRGSAPAPALEVVQVTGGVR